MTSIPRRLAVSRGRGSLLWAVAVFVVGQAGLGVWLHRTHPQMLNPTWDFRLSRLRDRLREAPGRPLVLALGSSRAANGLSPADMGVGELTDGPEPVAFNFATLGGGPIRELLTLRRLLAHGIRPDWLLVEVWPGFWMDKGLYEEHSPIIQCDAHLSDLPVLDRVYGCGWESFPKVVEANLLPFVHARAEVLHAYAPSLESRFAGHEISWSRVHWGNLDPWGWLPVAWPQISPEQFRAHLDDARNRTQPILNELEVPANADWAIRELLRECGRHHIRVALLYMPEHSALRGWYPQRARVLVQDYLTRLHREYGVAVIDTRDWLGDDGFQDSLHLHAGGARIYSARLGREALRPLLEGAALPAHATLRLDRDGETTGSTRADLTGP